jgi:hypothetical protein
MAKGTVCVGSPSNVNSRARANPEVGGIGGDSR